MKALKRNISLIGFLLAMTLVFTSYYFQHALSFRPCLLCTIQRDIFIALAMVFFLAFAHQYFRGPARSYSIITAVLSVLGAAAAGRQLWLQSLPSQPNGTLRTRHFLSFPSAPFFRRSESDLHC